MPFVGDAVPTSDLDADGWTCRPNLTNTMTCSIVLAIEGVDYARLALQLTTDNRVKQLTMSLSEAASPLQQARALATHLTRIATLHGFTCGDVPHGAGQTACEKSGMTLAVTTYSDRGYAMATVNTSATP